MRLSRVLSCVLLAGAVAAVVPSVSLAAGGGSGAKVEMPRMGKIGETIVNPYDIAPLTAIIKNGGYELKGAKVTIRPKPGGQTISYNVDDSHLKTHGGIPVFGLYADYDNTVAVEYTRIANCTKIYKIIVSSQLSAAPVPTDVTSVQQCALFTHLYVTHVDKEFGDRP